MVQFKCLHSGTVTSFENEWDIRTMRSHPDYVEVEKEEITPVAEKPSKKSVTKTEE